VDIEGAKVLKRRLGTNAAGEVPPPLQAVSADAPPLYRWVGVDPGVETISPAADADGPARSTSFLRRLGLNVREEGLTNAG
jgi:hypothetical protein